MISSHFDDKLFLMTKVFTLCLESHKSRLIASSIAFRHYPHPSVSYHQVYSFWPFSPTYRRVICDAFILAFYYLLGLSCCLDFLLLSVLLMDTIRRQMFCVVNDVVAVPRVLRTWEGIFYLQAFFTLHSLILFVLPQVRILEGVFYAQAFFTLHSFPTFLRQTAFIEFSQGTGSSTRKATGDSCWGLKHSPSHNNPLKG